ncbi:uncharacterized protein Z519_10740 [Cladophialophora bantiana CBS 173.52]|uniref:AAA+ ATPase domain-containing protein n=1 Tax=Cladophialophora bantiana (strain ATCC 10958 / CBS 173.52 / CDC B-1940 / NIH 8579) TaxID=1442370 RepID=A0A0D2HVT6_CLAB1|nr:uncharacterized protein Z519_10740 [Cladophialophora bantiana CBS 173.52]KIW88694.1 hypothetical protein Z519_10740 [Cladophialophora bantiana CBS 173.52]
MAASSADTGDEHASQPPQSRAMSVSTLVEDPDNGQHATSLSALRRLPNPFSVAASAFGAMFHPSERASPFMDQRFIDNLPLREREPAGFIPHDGSFQPHGQVAVADDETVLAYTVPEAADQMDRERNHGYFQLMQGRPPNASDGCQGAQAEEIKTCPLFSNHVQKALRNGIIGVSDPNNTAFPQYGLLGMREQTYNSSVPDTAGTLSLDDDLVFANMNAPWSAFICGSQGAGKSHSLSCLLENSLLASSSAGENLRPLAGLVFHYDKFTSSESTQLCEAAYLCSSGIPVRILVSPSNIHAMHRLYRNLPGLPKDAPRPEVIPLYFQENQLNVTRLMTLMAIDDQGKIPLYMEVLFKVLRDMTVERKGAGGVDYLDFKDRLLGKDLSSQQSGPLRLRLEMLESFLADKDQPAQAMALLKDMFKSAQGSLTIIDLSCPFVNENDACTLFTICLSIFMENRGDCGRIIALDEAHKFLTRSGEAEKLTDELTSIVRQQRHLASRVIVSTQEPTLAPRFIDLCNVCIVHRFNSPAWFDMLQGHLAGASRHKEWSNTTLFEMIVGLETGEALIFCPAALFDVYNGNVRRLKDAFIRVRIRNRVTADGGKSILASDKMKDMEPGELLIEDLIRPFAMRAVHGVPTIPAMPALPTGLSVKQAKKAQRRAVKAGRVTKSQTPLSRPDNLSKGLAYRRARGQQPKEIQGPTEGSTHISAQGPTQYAVLRSAQGLEEDREQGGAFCATPPTDPDDLFAPTSSFVPLASTLHSARTPSFHDLLPYLRNAVSESLRKDPTGIAFGKVRSQAARSAGLPEGFFSASPWKAWSRRVINEQVAKHAEAYGIPLPLRH